MAAKEVEEINGRDARETETNAIDIGQQDGKEMSTPAPPSLVKAKQGPLNARDKSLIGLAVVIGVLSVTIYVLRQFEFIRPFSVPTSAMAPAVSRGDHVIMEGLTFLARKPQRGDIAVFKTDGIASLPRSQIYFKRIVGEPGDRVRISEGQALH